MPDPILLRLADRTPLGTEAFAIRLEPREGGRLPPFRAGQFVQLWFDTPEGPTRRSYSLANPPESDASATCWELGITRRPGGVASDRLQALPLGARVEATGPFGRFGLTTRDRAPRVVLLATGTGVAPFRSLMPSLARMAADHGTRVTLACGARHAAALPWLMEWQALARREPWFEFVACLSREAPPAQEPDWVQGHVQAALTRFAPQPDDLALLCGHPDMVDDCFARLRQAGLPVASLRRERYIAQA